MKKITLLLVLLIGVFANAQSFVIGTGAASTSGTASDPVDGYFESFRYQIVYTATELSAALTPYDQITALGFSVDEDYGGGTLSAYTIKMGHTAATNSAAHNVDATTIVKNSFDYDPTVTAAGSFDMISFDTPFVWNGTDNIVIEICSEGPNAFIEPFGGVRGTILTTAGSRRFRVDGAIACDTDTATTSSNRPNIMFDYTDGLPPSCLPPTDGVANVTSTTTATLSWTTGGAANAEVIVQLAGTGVPTAADNTGANVSGTTYSATSLVPLTDYEFYVRDECTIGTDFSTWAGPFTFNTTVIPGCATNLTPLDGAVDIFVPDNVTFSWNAPTTGNPATSYDLYYGLTPTTVNILVGNYITTYTNINVSGYATTFYWKIVAKNTGGEATGCPIWSFTTIPAPGYCLDAPYGQYPLEPAGVTPDTCDGLYENIITDAGFAGEYSLINVTLGQTYVFKSSIATDLITISADDGATAAAYGMGMVTWVATLTGQVFFYTHLDDQCTADSTPRTRSVICGLPAPDAPDFVSLVGPASASITQGGTVTVFGEVFEAGLTDATTGQAGGINAWVGYSDLNTNPNTWSNWVPATFNAETNTGANDQYMATIGDILTPGTYYYATRFNLNNGAYYYGGIDASNSGNFWNGTTYLSGVLTVNPPPAPANDECANAIVLTAGATYGQYLTDGTNFGATTSTQVTPITCNGFAGNDVWFSVVVPASGTITIETGDSSTGESNLDTVITAYTGNCNNPLQLACNDDNLTAGTAYSILVLTGQTPGTTILLRVYEYNNDTTGGFGISAYDASLSTSIVEEANFKYYPNPVNNVLNVSLNQIIDSIEVYNLLGQKVITATPNANQTQLDVSNLTEGAYLVKVTSNNQTKSFKVLKQ